MVRKLDDYPDDDDKTINSVLVAAEIIDVVEGDPGLTFTDIAEQVSVSESSVHYYLNTLSRIRYLVRERGGWYPGLRLLELGRTAAQRKQAVGRIEPVVDELARQTEQTALLAVENDGQCVFVYQSFGDGTEDPTYHIGKQLPLHCTAFGKIILTFLSDTYRDRVFREQEFPEYTDRTVTSRGGLMQEVHRTVARPYRYSDGQYREGTCSVAAPILTEELDDFFGAIGIVGDSDAIDAPADVSSKRQSEETHADVVIRLASAARSRME